MEEVTLTGTPAFAETGADYGKLLSAADWSKMETVTVTLTFVAVKGHAEHGMKGTIEVR